MRAFPLGGRYNARMSKGNAGKDAKEASGTGEARLRRPERRQVEMKFECPDDLIPQGHQARAVWEVVAGMDLSAFLEPIKAREGVCGRDATDPKLLTAVWLYATIRGIGSAREVARLCLESKPFQWICGGVTLNHHLLSDFRAGHADALDGLFTRTVAAMVKNGVAKVTRISQDGTRVRA